MERIVLEVDDKIARDWRYASEQKKTEVTATMNKFLDMAFAKQTDDDFISFMKEIQDKAANRGLTEELLNEIMNDKD